MIFFYIIQPGFGGYLILGDVQSLSLSKVSFNDPKILSEFYDDKTGNDLAFVCVRALCHEHRTPCLNLDLFLMIFRCVLASL